MTAALAARSTAPDRLEKALGVLALVMLAFIVAALFKGIADWPAIPSGIWLHLASIMLALILTPVLLWRQRGTTAHRTLGYVWSGAMFLTAVDSLFVTTSNPGHFSPIHILSVMTIVLVPVLVLAARSHNVARHRRTVRGLIIGALLIAGFFTFPFNRLLGHWLFS
ncbi:DUF2306 domain-containing protein [Novosphingobium sp. Leaf2]|uniref:DUF2306 domain-containing protein n=1 Tax=Novosphingobium sp. Leaf2 TaxID=1735670 RepID=UPI0006F24711|nr:DUF2306 domain-containing protein [Novosphingobium sp. Leaf2]KQM22111.1 hypothetical protein ASE49_02045 [Novosphingobium sp. Leaf2]